MYVVGSVAPWHSKELIKFHLIYRLTETN